MSRLLLLAAARPAALPSAARAGTHQSALSDYQSDRCVRPGEAGGAESPAVAAGRPADAAPPPQPGPDRPAADAGGDEHVPRRRRAGRLRAPGRAAAQVATL